MHNIYFIAILALICGIGLSVAIQESNQQDKVINKSIHNITVDELKLGRGSSERIKLWPKGLSKWCKPLKTLSTEAEQELPETVSNKQDIDRLIDRIKRDIAFFEKTIENDKTMNNARVRQMTHLEGLKKLLFMLEKKEKSVDECFSEYETLRLKYIEDCKRFS